MTITSFIDRTADANYQYAPQSKFQNANIWWPDWDPGWTNDVYPVFCWSSGGTGYNPGTGARELAGNTVNVLSTTGDTITPIVVTLEKNHNLSGGESITIEGVQGNTNANVTTTSWTASATDEITLTGTTGNGAYVTGTGYVRKNSVNTSRSEELARMMSNDLGAVVITHDYRPAGIRDSRSEDPERRFFPEFLQDFALVVQGTRLLAEDAVIGAVGKSLSTDPAMWFKAGNSSGGWASGLTQLMPDGAFPYGSGLASHDRWTPRHTHACNAVYASTPQTALSSTAKGGDSDAFWSTYGEYGWAGAYFMPGHVWSDSAPVSGWDQIPLEVRRRADWAEWIRTDNPRATRAGFFLSAGGSATPGYPKQSLVYDPIGQAHEQRIELWDWRLSGSAPAPIDNYTATRVGTIQAIAAGGTGLSIFRRGSGSWTTDGFIVGERVESNGFDGVAANNGRWVVDSIQNGGLDLYVEDSGDAILDEAAESFQYVGRGPRLLDLHDAGHCYLAYHHLLAAGNTISQMEAGGTGSMSTNLDTGTQYVNNIATHVANVKTWLVSTMGWTDPV